MPLLSRGLGPHQCSVAWPKTYLHAKFHLDPSNRLATIHKRYRQTDTDRTGQTGQDRQWRDSIGQTVLQTVAPKKLKPGLVSLYDLQVRNSCRGPHEVENSCQNGGSVGCTSEWSEKLVIPSCCATSTTGS